MDSGGDFEACGAVDDGFLADVLGGGGVGDVEACAAGGGVDTSAARRREGVELHVEALVAGGDAGVADCDGHGSYDTTCSTKGSGLARSPLSFEHEFWTPKRRRVAGGLGGVHNRSILDIELFPCDHMCHT